MKLVEYKKLYNFSKKILIKCGLNKFTSDSVSFSICQSSLRGVDSHGIKLLPHYVNSSITGRKNPKAKFKFKKIFPSLITLDADHGYGITAGFKAIDYGVKVATKQGIAAISVYNSTHCAALAPIVLRAADKGFIAFGFTNADSLMLSFNGKSSYFGTNPICVAAPRVEKEPFCLDMATTGISWNKLLNFKKTNKKIKPGYAANSKGLSTSNPNHAKSLFPSGEYKGFGLASMVEILCGIYSTSLFGTHLPPMYTSPMNKKRKVGQFYIVLRTDANFSSKTFKSRLQKMTDEVRQQPKRAKEKVILPNDKEVKTKKIRLKNGIPVDNDLIKQFNKLSTKYKINISF